MSALVWAVVAVLAIPLAYAVLCTTFLLYVRLPDDAAFAALEDVLLLLASPFVAAVLGLSLVSRGR